MLTAHGVTPNEMAAYMAGVSEHIDPAAATATSKHSTPAPAPPPRVFETPPEDDDEDESDGVIADQFGALPSISTTMHQQLLRDLKHQEGKEVRTDETSLSTPGTESGLMKVWRVVCVLLIDIMDP